MEKKNKKKTAVIIGGALLLIIAVGTAVFLMTGKEEPEGYTINEENYQQIQEDIGNEVKEGYFETYMNTDWTFPDGTSETTNAVLGNSPNNKKPIRCEVLLEETDELVFSTGVLPVGAELPAFKLDVDLDAGTYDAVCMVYLLDEAEGGTYIDYSSAGFHVTITVEN
ncbi:hypothetical protein VV089_03525 [Candidatus Merdisoma sp. JLR.KK011]|uniref:hypothetical protein n=1 Tax=Candidatus Merdisoma sp. JLR.KK011 TaxID=3114299 RepID=UPI002FF3AAFA